MYNQNCKICGAENVDDGHFWKTHKTKISTYYLTTYNKRDLLTSEIVPFYNKTQYLSQDFINRRNLKEWLRRQSVENKQNYLKQLLLKRKQYKDLVYTPTQTELRSLDIMPGVVTFNEVFGDYYKLCEELGFRSRGHKNADIIYKNQQTPILIDTREQNPILFKDSEITTLKYGDYTTKDSDIFIDRKSLQDFIGTISSGYDRFSNEIFKALTDNVSIVMLVENSLSDCLSFNYKYAGKYTKATPEFVFHRLRELIQKFPNFQAAFCENRGDMKEKILKILDIQNICEIDLQLATDREIL